MDDRKGCAPATVFRSGLLAGRAVAFAGRSAPIAAACEALGASTHALDPARTEDELHADVTALDRLDALVCESRDLEHVWNATRAAVNAAFRPAGAGKIVFVAPADDAPARAALENLARTTSIEWARYGVTTAAILPGERTSPDEVASLAAYLVSEAGAYFSGCAFTLGAVPEPSSRQAAIG
jgi:NAD(P)-dependent dehydrogenase (short-subunit alcohol dehydrogenase family)